ncbi:MAG: flagellar motor switch protein FliN [Proteobacteria bacterium]|nr:flagellar motor switch protein FliN [Pseudomonadota bacterium]
MTTEKDKNTKTEFQDEEISSQNSDKAVNKVPDLEKPKLGDFKGSLEAVYDVPMKVSVVLGSTSLKIGQALKLSKGSIIELDRKVGDPVDLYVGDRLIARGEVVLVDNKVGLTLTELVQSEKII